MVRSLKCNWITPKLKSQELSHACLLELPMNKNCISTSPKGYGHVNGNVSQRNTDMEICWELPNKVEYSIKYNCHTANKFRFLCASFTCN